MACAVCQIHPIRVICSKLLLFVFYSEKKLERIQVADEDQFFESLQEILRNIHHEELNSVFQVWIGRGQEVSQDNGDYVR
jgi:hypothetical protein